MSDIVEDRLRQLVSGNVPPEEPETPAPAEEAEIEAAPEPTAEDPATTTTAPQKSRITNLDDIILDDPRIPESLRGQPATALFEDRNRGWHERQAAGFDKNRLEAERNAAFTLLENLAKSLEGKQQPAIPAAPPSSIDRLRNEGIDSNAIFTDSERALATTIDLARQGASESVKPMIDKLEAQLASMQKERADEKTAAEQHSWQSAYWAAKPPNVSDQAWDEFAGLASAFALMTKSPLGDKQSYAKAHEWYRTSGQAILGATAQTPPTQAPTAPAPPVGGARPAAVVTSQKPSARLNNHDRQAMSTVLNIFKETAPSVDLDKVLDGLKADPKTKEMFP